MRKSRHGRKDFRRDGRWRVCVARDVSGVFGSENNRAREKIIDRNIPEPLSFVKNAAVI